jgi:hypothetical protein
MRTTFHSESEGKKEKIRSKQNKIRMIKTRSINMMEDYEVAKIGLEKKRRNFECNTKMSHV